MPLSVANMEHRRGDLSALSLANWILRHDLNFSIKHRYVFLTHADDRTGSSPVCSIQDI